MPKCYWLHDCVRWWAGQQIKTPKVNQGYLTADTLLLKYKNIVVGVLLSVNIWTVFTPSISAVGGEDVRTGLCRWILTQVAGVVREEIPVQIRDYLNCLQLLRNSREVQMDHFETHLLNNTLLNIEVVVKTNIYTVGRHSAYANKNANAPLTLMFWLFF